MSLEDQLINILPVSVLIPSIIFGFSILYTYHVGKTKRTGNNWTDLSDTTQTISSVLVGIFGFLILAFFVTGWTTITLASNDETIFATDVIVFFAITLIWVFYFRSKTKLKDGFKIWIPFIVFTGIWITILGLIYEYLIISSWVTLPPTIKPLEGFLAAYVAIGMIASVVVGAILANCKLFSAKTGFSFFTDSKTFKITLVALALALVMFTYSYLHFMVNSQYVGTGIPTISNQSYTLGYQFDAESDSILSNSANPTIKQVIAVEYNITNYGQFGWVTINYAPIMGAPGNSRPEMYFETPTGEISIINESYPDIGVNVSYEDQNYILLRYLKPTVLDPSYPDFEKIKLVGFLPAQGTFSGAYPETTLNCTNGTCLITIGIKNAYQTELNYTGYTLDLGNINGNSCTVLNISSQEQVRQTEFNNSVTCINDECSIAGFSSIITQPDPNNNSLLDLRFSSERNVETEFELTLSCTPNITP